MGKSSSVGLIPQAPVPTLLPVYTTGVAAADSSPSAAPHQQPAGQHQPVGSAVMAQEAPLAAPPRHFLQAAMKARLLGHSRQVCCSLAQAISCRNLTTSLDQTAVHMSPSVSCLVKADFYARTTVTNGDYSQSGGSPSERSVNHAERLGSCIAPAQSLKCCSSMKQTRCMAQYFSLAKPCALWLATGMLAEMFVARLR